MKSRSRLGSAVVAIAIVAGAAAAGSSVAAGVDPAAATLDVAPHSADVRDADTGANGLSIRLEELAAPSLRSARTTSQAQAVGLPTTGPGSIQRQGDKLIVQARLGGSPDVVVPRLRDAGADILFVSDDYGTVDLAGAAEDLQAIADVEGVDYVSELLQPQTNGDPGCGSITSEADAQMKAALARETYDVDGTGVTVGIISDSYNQNSGAKTSAKDDVKSGDLPGADNDCGRKLDVRVLEEGFASGIDEGRAMAQLVHDIAPGARLMFAGPGNSEEGMAQNILDLRDAGADVIVDDLTYLAEPAYQDGAIANAVTEVTNDGAIYFSSAANSNVIDNTGNEVGSFEGQAYRPLAAASCSDFSATSCMDFDSGAGTDNCIGFTIRANTKFTAVLQWAEPRNGVTTDLDLYVNDLTGQVAAGESKQNNIQSGIPAEIVNVSNTTNASRSFCFLIDRKAGAGTPRLKLFMGRASITSIQYAPGSGGDVFGPTIYSHNGTAAAMTTAAVPYDDSTQIEEYSSRGPVTLTHGPVNGGVPAAPLGSPLVLNKPDIAATDGGQTTFFLPVGGGISRFYGTSAAAPHAAGVAALQIQRNSTATVAQIKNAQTSTADDVGGFPALAQGAGLVDAAAAVGALSEGPDIATACLAAQAEYDKQLKKLAKLQKKKQTKSVKKKVKKQKKKVKDAKAAMEAACP